MSKVKITDAFWKNEQELVRTEVIPYQWNALNDNVKDAAPSYCMRNFRIAGELNKKRKEAGCTEIKYPIPRDKWEFLPKDSEKDTFHGFVFQDTDVYKWLEAVGYSLMNHPDADLEATADRAIDAIEAAQLENGYLDTLYVINDKDLMFTDLRDKHELYCFGHLCEGAIAYYHATGKRKILDVTIRFADFIYDWFVGGDTKGYPGHEIAEMALAKLYKETGNKKYLELAQYFVDHRGEQPYYFDVERSVPLGEKNKEQLGEVVFYDREEKALKYHYNQAHLPVRQQHEAVGHAVRGVYLYSGMADIAAMSGDETLKKACEELFDNIADKKLYITGGIGSTHAGEAFSAAYDLPNDMAYSESCASIGLMFFAYRMLKLNAKVKYADVMERALYNCVLAGMAKDGKSFFYVNPLEVNPRRIHGDERMGFVKPVRQKWFGCACCPPNIARLISSLGDYIISEDNDTVYTHLLIASDIALSGEKGTLHIDADLTRDGRVEFDVEHRKDLRLAVRIPYWGRSYKVTRNGNTVEKNELNIKDGYIYFDIRSDEKIIIDYEIKPVLVGCNPLVQENVGKAAVMRGPFVYCLEQVDNGENLHLLKLSDNPELTYKDGIITAKGMRMETEVNADIQAARDKNAMKSNGAADDNENGLYTDNLYNEYKKAIYKPVQLTFVPYYSWANRGENEMTVYVRV